MSRPEELSKQQAEAALKNDERIIEALKQLEQAAAAGKPFPTVDDISAMAGVSRNTVRNRAWALGKLKDIKATYKAARASKTVSEGGAGSPAEHSPEQWMATLRKQVNVLLLQNALLYEEVLYLGKLVATKDVELDELRASRAPTGNVRYMR